jgi:tetratricopeptide (TPR) repeat protein
MKAFVKVSELLQTIGQGQTVHYVTVLINIAGCLRLEGKLEESLEYFQNSRAILDNLQHQNTQDNERIKYLQATILNNISLLYIDQDKLEEALASATAAMQMITEGTGDDHELATSYNNLSNIYLKMGDYDKARAANDKALRIYDRMPKENVHHAAALLTFAKLNMGRGRLSEVREAFAQALELTEHFYGKNREYKQLKVEIEIFNEAALELECVHLDDLKSKSRNLDFYRYYDKDEYRC